MPTHLDALIKKIRSGKPRTTPDPGAEEVLATKIPADLRALLEAWNAHHVRRIRIGELRLEDGQLESPVPTAGTNQAKSRKDRACIGMTGGGDLWTVEYPSTAATSAVYFAAHEDDFEETLKYSSIDELISGQVDEAKAEGDEIDIEV